MQQYRHTCAYINLIIAQWECVHNKNIICLQCGCQQARPIWLGANRGVWLPVITLLHLSNWIADSGR